MFRRTRPFLMKAGDIGSQALFLTTVFGAVAGCAAGLLVPTAGMELAALVLALAAISATIAFCSAPRHKVASVNTPASDSTESSPDTTPGNRIRHETAGGDSPSGTSSTLEFPRSSLLIVNVRVCASDERPGRIYTTSTGNSAHCGFIEIDVLAESGRPSYAS